MNTTLTHPSANGAALVDMLLGAARRTCDAIRAWQARSAEAQALAKLDDHVRRDVGLPMAAARPPRFPMI